MMILCSAHTIYSAAECTDGQACHRQSGFQMRGMENCHETSSENPLLIINTFHCVTVYAITIFSYAFPCCVEFSGSCFLQLMKINYSKRNTEKERVYVLFCFVFGKF